MTQVIFDIMSAYAAIYRKIPTPIIYDPNTRRLKAIRNFRQLIPSLISCTLIMGLFSVGPKFLQLCYLLFLKRQLGHFPTPKEDPFAAPMQLVSIALVLICSGGGVVTSGFMYICHANVVPDINAIIGMAEFLENEIITKNKPTEKSRQFVSTVRYAPHVVLYMTPALSIYALFKGLDPLSFIIHWIPKKVLGLEVWLLAKLFSLVNLSLACVTSGQVLLGMGYVLVFAIWLLLHNVKLVDAMSRGR